MTIGNILGHVFMDVGAAWDNSREFTNYSLLQAKYGNNLSNDFSPWVRTVGYGIKLPIFLPWRIEAAYDWTESGLSKPQWYISLGYDWQFLNTIDVTFLFIKQNLSYYFGAK